MKLWKRLYNTIWLAFFSCVLIPRWMGPYAGPPVHVLLGLAMLAMTRSNAQRLAALPVPPRLQRISKATSGFALFQAVGGLALGAVTHLIPSIPVVGSVLRGAHVVCALTILAQTASLATGYDMWEEKEFGPIPPDSKTPPEADKPEHAGV
jgi:hypothetical protein